MKLGVNTLDQRRRAAAVWLSAGIGALVLLALVLSLQLTALAAPSQTTWYVHPNGSNGNPGSLLLPFATIQYAIGVASDGDTILVAAGTYTENLVITETLTLRGGYTVSGTAWLPRTGETVVDGSGSQTVLGDWDGHGIYAPAVISDAGQFEMWYTGFDLYDRAHLGQAASSNGITWTKSVSNPLLDGHEAVVLKEGPNDYKMWYNGDDGNIYRATSTDGLDWTVDPAPVFEPTHQDGSWERDLVSDPSIVQDGGGVYWMFYEAANWDWNIMQIGVATSTNGVDWFRVQAAPVLTTGAPGDWDGSLVLDPMVILDGGDFKMWYSGQDDAGTRRIGYATSTDGVIWTKDAAHNPVLEHDPGTWDEGYVGNHFVYYDGDYEMWYSSNGHGQIGYATSTDGITWTKPLSDPVLTPGTPGQWGDPVVRFESGSDGAVLDGFTITGGDAEIGGGVLIEGSSAVIANSIIRGNTGGIVNSGILTITSSIIEDNSGGTRAVVSSENFAETNRLVMDGCTIRGNSTPGAVCITTGYAEIRNTKIVDNVVTDPNVHIVRIGEAGTTPTVEMINVFLADNESEQPVVDVTSETGSAMLMNVTVTGNQIPGNPILHTHGAMTLTNIIVWGNTTSADMLGGPGTLLVSYSDIEGGWTGTGNLDADPLFVDAANGDYHLKPGSPCIDAGTPVGAPATDIEGATRDATPDMGAYEWSGFRIFLPLVLRNF